MNNHVVKSRTSHDHLLIAQSVGQHLQHFRLDGSTSFLIMFEHMTVEEIRTFSSVFTIISYFSLTFWLLITDFLSFWTYTMWIKCYSTNILHIMNSNSSFTYLFLIFQVFAKFFIKGMFVTSKSNTDTICRKKKRLF